MAYAEDLKSLAERRKGSSPLRTTGRHMKTKERESSVKLKTLKQEVSRVNNLNAALNTAKKRGTSEQLISDLQNSISDAKVKESVSEIVIEPIECKECKGYGQHIQKGEDKSDCVSCEGTGYENHKEMNMAAKKKSAKSKKSNGKAKVERAPGRERKMLIRFSDSEYNTLQANAKEAEVSMAHLIRKKCGLLSA